ncbi:MAG: MTH938/NDUFAF3 family protein [Desulfobacterales bacterium]
MMIESYVSGRSMRVAGKTYSTDLKIIGDTVKDNWWRREGHRLLLDDIVDILESRPDILVVGTGYAGNLDVPASLRKNLAERGVRLITEHTAEAVELFNRHRAQKESVAGAFHLTC